MGVRGLTSYIARNAERYLTPYELNDCNLVIDGDNLACNLFKDVVGSNPAFGGDYDALYRTVVNFFQLLKECHVRPFVLMDGGYEWKKLKTLEQRLRAKIGMVKHLNPLQSRPLFPLMMREVFVDAAKDCGVQVMRCIFEADDEIAILARKLNCPLLSYDSDFYIHNVKYIPLVTLTLKVHTKSESCPRIARTLRHCEARNIAKRMKIRVEGHNSKPCKISHQKTVKYLDCCIYTIKNLAGAYLRTEMLPIFAALLGNDYINRGEFKKFYAQLGLRGSSNTVPKQQKRIKAILKWLRHETKESAIEKILARVPTYCRPRLLSQLKGATSGYSSDEVSVAFNFFGLDEGDIDGEVTESSGESDSEEEIEDEISPDEESEGGIEDDQEEEQVTEKEGEKSESDEEGQTSPEDNANDENDSFDNTDLDRSVATAINPSLKSVPEWLKQRIYNAELPRYFSDLVHLRMYINNPLVENFLFEDCNQIALKILQYIFTIVNQPEMPEMRYLTRVVRLTNVHYKTVQPLELSFTYDPENVDLDNFQRVFRDFPDCEQIFEHISKIPDNCQLYFLSIVYWARRTKRSTHVHLHSLIVCMIALMVIDSKVDPIRDATRYQKKYGRIATKARKAKEKLKSSEVDMENEIKETVQDNCNQDSNELLHEKCSQNLKLTSQSRPIQERIKHVAKVECILAMENLLKYFHINECFQKRHNDFSSSILHGFSEFQSVFYHLSSLNALFNYPFESVRIAQCFNGMFLYNMYASLRTRLDIQYYVLHFIFHESPMLADFYVFLVDWCSDLLLLLQKNDTFKPIASKKQTRNKKKAPLGDGVSKIDQEGETVDVIASDSNSDESDYNDLNNKFCMLMKAR